MIAILYTILYIVLLVLSVSVHYKIIRGDIIIESKYLVEGGYVIEENDFITVKNSGCEWKLDKEYITDFNAYDRNGKKSNTSHISFNLKKGEAWWWLVLGGEVWWSGSGAFTWSNTTVMEKKKQRMEKDKQRMEEDNKRFDYVKTIHNKDIYMYRRKISNENYFALYNYELNQYMFMFYEENRPNVSSKISNMGIKLMNDCENTIKENYDL